MEWVALLIAAVTVIVGTLTAGNLLENRMDPEIKSRLGCWLSGKGARPLTSWTQIVNGAFLSGFDLLYSVPKKKLQREDYEFTFSGLLLAFLWWGLLLAPIVLIAVRGAFWLMGVQGPNTTTLLLISIGVAYSNIAPAAAVWLVYTLRKGRNIETTLFWTPMFLPPLVILGVFIYLGVQEAVTWWRIVSVALGAAGFTLAGSNGALSVGPLGFVHPEKHRVNPRPVNPLKALVWSLVFIVLVGLIRRDAGLAFIQLINQEGFTVLGFVAFNIFADAVSLVETRWVLTTGAKAGVRGLVGLLLLDLILSAAIFLVIPTILWELPQFWEAIRFAGPRPWLGILFWTTFSTSVLLYLFVVAALLTRALAALAQVVRWVAIPFNLQGQPVFSVSVAMAVVASLGFLVGGIVSVL